MHCYYESIGELTAYRSENELEEIDHEDDKV